jgi:hypothetical protein
VASDPPTHPSLPSDFASKVMRDFRALAISSPGASRLFAAPGRAPTTRESFHAHSRPWTDRIDVGISQQGQQVEPVGRTNDPGELSDHLLVREISSLRICDIARCCRTRKTTASARSRCQPPPLTDHLSIRTPFSVWPPPSPLPMS